MMEHNTLSRDEIRSMIQHKKIRFAGNVPAKIYGALACKSGKRMKKENRISRNGFMVIYFDLKKVLQKIVDWLIS